MRTGVVVTISEYMNERVIYYRFERNGHEDGGGGDY